MDLGNLLTPTAAWSSKGPTKPFVPHRVAVTKPRSLPPTGEAPRMKPRPSDRLDLDAFVTHGRFGKWTGDSSAPLSRNHSWWQGEAAGSVGSVQEQRRQRGGGVGGGAAGRAARQQRELNVSKDRFGRELKDALRTGSFESERNRPGAAASKRTLDPYDSSRLQPAKHIGARHQYVSDCTDVIHRDWAARFAVPRQAVEADSVARIVAGELSQQGGTPALAPEDVGTFRVMPPLREVERVYHMNSGYGAGGKRFSSVFARTARSAREGYVNNDTCIGRTTPVGDRDTASKAPPLPCLALATVDVARARREQDEAEARGRAAGGGDAALSYTTSRGVRIAAGAPAARGADAALPALGVASASAPLPVAVAPSAWQRPGDTSLTRLSGLAREGRVAAVAPFAAVNSAALRLVHPAGI